MAINPHQWILFFFLLKLSQTLATTTTTPTHITTLAVSTLPSSPSHPSSSSSSHHRWNHSRSRSLPPSHTPSSIPSNSTLLTPPPNHLTPTIPTMPITSTTSPKIQTAIPPNPTTNTTPPPPSSQQVINIIDTLIGSGDFGDWVRVISGASPLFVPQSATLFVPQDTDQTPHSISDPFVFPYHVIPQRLTFSELLLFKINTRVPTLLPGRSIIITSNSRSHFTVDDTPITQPDAYLTDSVAVHAIARLLDYNAYGNGLDKFPKPSQQNQTYSGSPLPKEGIPWRSEARPRICVAFQVALLAVFTALLSFKNVVFNFFFALLILKCGGVIVLLVG